MTLSSFSLASVASMLAMLPAALAGYNAGGSKNVAVYWGKCAISQGREYSLTEIEKARIRTTRAVAHLLNNVSATTAPVR